MLVDLDLIAFISSGPAKAGLRWAKMGERRNSMHGQDEGGVCGQWTG